MKAMLLAAGRGERLRPLTDTTAKPLLKANGTSLIDFHLQKLPGAGIRTVVINTCWQADKIVHHIGNGSGYGLTVHYSHEDQALETAGGVAHARTLLGDMPFLLISSDVWTDLDFAQIQPLPPHGLAHLVMVGNPPHHPEGDFSLHHGLVTPRRNEASFTYSGIGIFHPQLFAAAINKAMPLRDVLQPAIDQHRVSGEHHRGQWMDVGTPQRLAQLNDYLSAAPP